MPIGAVRGQIGGSLDCIGKAKELEIVSGYFRGKFSPKTAPNKAFDAQRAIFFNDRVKWGMIVLEGKPADIGMCWVGGFVHSNKRWDLSWDAHKDLTGPSRNSAAISCAGINVTVSGLHYFNVHDGARMNDAFYWVVKHNWGEYIRDDCIENDHLQSGFVVDCLYDGCYTGISTEPSNDDTSSRGAGQRVTLDRVLLRLQAMPYPYKWQTKNGVIDVDGNPYSGVGIPYGHGNFFKIGSDIERNPHFSIKNCTFLAVHLTTPSKFDFPPESLIDACENNTVIWLGPGRFPGKLPTQKFPHGVRVVTGQEGRDLWRERVIDWHARHLEVGANRKPSSPGSLEFPKKFRMLNGIQRPLGIQND